MIASGTLTLCIDARIMTEYADVLSRPRFAFLREDIQALLGQIKAAGLIVAADSLSSALPDPGDEPFLEAALAGEAECLITGNLKDFPVSARKGLAVLAPRDFLDLYQKQRPARAKKQR
jgi:predicted nucleic acid-binding protein